MYRKPRLKIAFVAKNTSSHGGVPYHIFQLLTHIDQADLHLFTSRYQDPEPLKKYPPSIKIHLVELSRLPMLKEISFSYMAYKEIQKEFPSFDAVHAHGLSGFYFSVLNLLKIRKKYRLLVDKVHGTHTGYDLAHLKVLFRYNKFWLRIVRYGFEDILGSILLPISYILELVTYRGANKIIAISSSVANELKRYFRLSDHKVNVIYNGYRNIGNNRFNRRKIHDIPTIFYVGGIGLLKGLPYLILAIHILNKRGITVKCRIAGYGNESRLRELITCLGLNRNIKFIGFQKREEVYKEYFNNDIIVIPSLYEALGNVLIEAMKNNIPIIGSDVGGIRELLGIDRGTLFRAGDYQDLAIKIEETVKNYDQSLKHAKNAKLWANRHFDWSETAASTLDIIKR